MANEKKGFAYHKTKKRYVNKFIDGKWQKGKLTKNANVTLNESACVLQYAQTVFEGLKAYKTEDGSVVCFRPDLNAERLNDSCERMVIPKLPEGEFIKAVKEVVKANAKYIPPYGSNGSLYLRPYIFGYTPILGVKPAKEFEFRLFGSPVYSYFSGGAKPITIRISDYDRAAPRGTGHIKAGLNYAMSLYQITDAHEKGFDENLYLDSATRTYIEETGGANIIFIDKKGALVTPKSPTILPSITRRSLTYLAEHYLDIKVEERKIAVDELSDFVECGLCGTAAVISPVGKIVNGDKTYEFKTDLSDDEKTITKLYNLLRNIQLKKVKAPDGWILEIK